jgi:HEAT repeat protein
MKRFEKRNALLFQDRQPIYGTVTTGAPYANIIGAYLPASAFLSLREVDLCHRQVYDQYLVGSVANEVSGQHRQNVFQLEAGVHTVSHLAKVGDVAAIAAMAALLAHRHDRVRKAVVSAFPRIVVRGDRGAIAVVVGLVQHKEKNVRHAALNTLAEIAERGNGTAIAAVVAAFEDAEAYVRGAAVSVFAQIVEKGDATAIRDIVGLLEDTCSNVRCGALRTIAQIVEKGDADVIVAVAIYLEDTSEDVRLEAVCTLKQIAAKGDEVAIAEVSERLTHPHEEVRVAAVCAFQHIAKKGTSAMEAMAARLEDSDVAVRKVAVTAFLRVAENGNSFAIVALAARLEDAHGSVRNMAGEALLQIAGRNRSNIAAITALTAIADIKFHMTAALQIQCEDDLAGDEAMFSASASVESAKLHLTMRSHRLLMSAQARPGSHAKVTRSDNRSGKEYGRVRMKARNAGDPRVVKKSGFADDEIGGFLRVPVRSFFDRLIYPGIMNALIAFLAFFWVLLVNFWTTATVENVAHY